MFKKKSRKQEPAAPEPQRQQPDKWASAATLSQSQHSGSGEQGWNEQADLGPEDYNSSEWLSGKTKQVQNQSLQSSRRALERLHAAEDAGRRNLVTLANQGGIHMLC
jgi:synaptosomal-associated protein 29